MSAERDTERTAVRTYVPAYQKSEWEADAEELGMSQAEFVRTMVQAGRRGFDLGCHDADGPRTAVETTSPDSTPGVNDLESEVLDVLGSDDPYSWDELLGELTEDIEDRLDETLSNLQRRNRIEYSGRDGGYTVVEDGE